MAAIPISSRQVLRVVTYYYDAIFPEIEVMQDGMCRET
jgi:hypothetical protein